MFDQLHGSLRLGDARRQHSSSQVDVADVQPLDRFVDLYSVNQYCTCPLEYGR